MFLPGTAIITIFTRCGLVDMSTEDLVDELVQRFNGWNRDGDHGVLRYLNSAHNILMSMECEKTIIFDTVTEELPLLVTVSPTLRYVMPSNVWRIGAILIRSDVITNSSMSDYGINPQLMERPLRTTYKNTLSVGGRLYSKFPYVRSWDYVNSSTPAYIRFTADPGSHSDYYFRLSYKRPTQILSETIQCDIPEPLDFELLLPAAAKLIEGVQSGNYIEAHQYVAKEFKPALWKQMNLGEQGDLDMEPVSRDF
jgi:hypothetical protein